MFSVPSAQEPSGPFPKPRRPAKEAQKQKKARE
jgi:hypothetical protein